MPVRKHPKCPHTAQDAIGILVAEDIRLSVRVGAEQRGQWRILLGGKDDVPGTPNLQGEEFVRLNLSSILHQHGGMVRAQVAEKDVKRDGAGALLEKFT